MIENIVNELINNHQEDPCFAVCHNFGRGLIFNDSGPEEPHITDSKIINVWQVEGDRLNEKKDNINVLYDHENYIIQWEYQYALTKHSEKNVETILFQWKGTPAEKVSAPLPPLMEGKDPIVERAYQWSEPPVFFQIFPSNLVVISGKQQTFDCTLSRLFMVRGELQNEVNLFEIPCKKSSLRSRAVVFLVVPKKTTIFCWCGTAVPTDYKNLINQLNLFDVLKSVDKTWSKFQSITLEKEYILTEIHDSSDNSYIKIENILNFTPRLFYIYFFNEDIFGVEVEYSLRSSKHIAPFPFLQSHLYTATQPAIFLLDNGQEIWLWKGLVDEETDREKFKKEIKVAEELAAKYATTKEDMTGLKFSVNHTSAGNEPNEFRNIFPLWES